jgi:DNA-binding GntR family transcriptional regulator
MAATQNSTILGNKAYDFIKSAILNMDLRPGQPLVDSALAQRVQVSRTPVREALRRLQTEGLVVRGPRKGWRVCSLSREDIEQIFDLKESLEGLAARRAAQRITQQCAEQLLQIVKRMEEASQTADRQTWMALDAQYHEIIFRVVGNERLRQIVGNLNDQWHRLRVGHLAVEGRVQRASQEHRWIAEAIAAHDQDRAEAMMQQHLRNLKDSLVSVLENLVFPLVGNQV